MSLSNRCAYCLHTRLDNTDDTRNSAPQFRQLDPLVGTFAYIAKINQLVLYQYYPFDILNAHRLAGLLASFIQTAEKWRNAIASGSPGPPQLEAPLFLKGLR